MPFFGWQVELDAVAEGDEAGLVVVGVGGEGEQGRELGGQLALGGGGGAEAGGGADVDEQVEDELALFDVLLDVGRAHARRDVPVDEAHLVAGLVLAHLAELEAAAAEDAVVLAEEEQAHEAAGADLQAPDAGEHLLLGEAGGEVSGGGVGCHDEGLRAGWSSAISL